MRDFSQALAGMEVDGISLDNLGLSSRTRRRLHMFLDELIVRDYSKEYRVLSELDYGEDREHQISKLIEWRENSRKSVDLVLKVFMPNVDAEFPNALVIWPTVDSRGKGRSSRQAMKIGRALRRMFPVLTDTEIDNLVDVVKSKLIEQEFTYHVSKEASAFKKAYSYTQADSQNMDTTWSKKHMSNSCMRYEFDNLPMHPCEAYASGDFEMHWLETPEGKIAARSVVAVARAGAKITPQPAPIYAVSEEAWQFLWDKLKSAKCLDIADSDWVGCLLVTHFYNEVNDMDGMIAPYLDLDPRGLELTDCNKYMVVSRQGSIDASSYSGVLFTGDRYNCAGCGCGVSEDDRYTHYNSHDDNSWCEVCYWETYMNCENCGEDEPIDGSRDVQRACGYSQNWCEGCCDSHAVLCTDGELWQDEDVHLTVCGEYISQEEYENRWFTCALSGEIYHIDSKRSLDNGDHVAIENIEDHNAFFETKYIFDATNDCYFLDAPKPKDDDVILEESEAKSA